MIPNGVLIVMHDRRRMTIEPRTPTIPGGARRPFTEQIGIEVGREKQEQLIAGVFATRKPKTGGKGNATLTRSYGRVHACGAVGGVECRVTLACTDYCAVRATPRAIMSPTSAVVDRLVHWPRYGQER